MDVVDWDRIAELRDEVGEDNFAEVMAIFIDEMDEAVRALGTGSVDAGKMHFLKGAALNLGLLQLGNLSRHAEERLKSDPKAPVPTGPLCEAYTAARAELAALTGA